MYKCITSGDFEDKHDIIDDLNDRNKSLLITRISNSIKSNNDILQEEWNDDDNNKLYIILIKIYRDGYLDIEKYDETIFEAQSNPWIDKVIEITQQINETMLKQIPIDKVKKLFMEDSTMTESSIKSLGQQIFTAKAKKYGIKAIHANKIFNMLQTEEDEVKCIHYIIVYMNRFLNTF